MFNMKEKPQNEQIKSWFGNTYLGLMDQYTQGLQNMSNRVQIVVFVDDKPDPTIKGTINGEKLTGRFLNELRDDIGTKSLLLARQATSLLGKSLTPNNLKVVPVNRFNQPLIWPDIPANLGYILDDITGQGGIIMFDESDMQRAIRLDFFQPVPREQAALSQYLRSGYTAILSKNNQGRLNMGDYVRPYYTR